MADFLLALADFDGRSAGASSATPRCSPTSAGSSSSPTGAAHNRKPRPSSSSAFPEVEAALRSGELCFSTVNEVAKVLTPENKDEVLPRFFGLSRREAEQLAVSLRPAEVIPVRDVVTADPARRSQRCAPVAPAGRAASRRDPRD